MDSNAAKALVAAAIWLGVVLVVRFALARGFDRYERRLAETDPSVAARRRTTFSILLRAIVVLVALVGTWNVLSIFPVTEEVARAFLASSAVLAVVAGLALTTPLGNLGSGVMLALTQPVRLGDRIGVGEHVGVVDEITLSYTALATDTGRHVFVPNRQMVSDTLVNYSVSDPRRLVTVRLPLRLDTPVAEARRLATDAVARTRHGAHLAVEARVGEVTEKTVWLEVLASAPLGSDAAEIASDIREHALAALAEAKLLPAA